MASLLQSVPAPLNYANVKWQEIDISQTSDPQSAVTFGALIASQTGPVLDIQTFAGEDTLVSIFEEPTDTNYNEWFQVAKAFDYKDGEIGGTAKVVRVVGDGSLNGALAVTSTSLVNDTDLTTQRIDNKDQALVATIVFDTHTTANAGDDTEARLKFFTKFPTVIPYKVALATVTDFATADIVPGVSFLNEFDDAPTGTEVAVAVLDGDNEVLETIICDLTQGNVDGFNVDTYIEHKINNESEYILAYVNESVTDLPISFEATEFKKNALVTPIKADYLNGLELFEDADYVDVNYMIGHSEVIDEMITLCESRKDVSLRWSPLPSMLVGKTITSAVDDLIEYTGTTLNRNTTYGSFYANCGLIYDKYNTKSRWISLSGDIVGMRILRNLQSNPWFAAAGPNHQFKNIIKLAINPKPNYQIILNKGKANSVISKANVGKLIAWTNNYTSQKSLLQLETTRELNIYIWRANRMFLYYKLFEQNDDITRALIRSQMTKFMTSVEAGRGIEPGWQVICDSRNNTSTIINQQRLVCTIIYTPIGHVREIVLSAIISASGQDVEELL
jgi:hypothetical protein